MFYLSEKEPFLDGSETGTTLVLSSSAGGEPHNYQRRGGKVNREEVGDSAEVEGTRHMHLCSMFPPAKDSYRRSKLLSQRSAKRELRHTYFRRKLLFLTVMTFKFPRGVRHTLGRKFRARLHAISLHPCCVLKLPRYRINRWRRVYCTVYEGQVSGTYE
jgi:hypothetical protein